MDLVPQDSSAGLVSHHQVAARLYQNVSPEGQVSETHESILTRLRRQKLTLFITFFGILMVVAAAYAVLPRSYRAEAMVTIAPNEQVLASIQPSDSQQLTVGDASDLESQSLVLSSPMLLREVLLQAPVQEALLLECQGSVPPAWKHALNSWLSNKPDLGCDAQLTNLTQLVEKLRSHMTVGVTGRSRVLSVSYSSSLASVAQTVANAIVQTYLTSQTEEKLQPRSQAIEWLTVETKRVADRLKQTEVRISASLHENGVIKGQTAPIASEQLTGLAQQIAVAEAERAAAAGRMQQSTLSGGATTGVLEDRTVNDEKQQLSAINLQIAQLSSRYGNAYHH